MQSQLDTTDLTQHGQTLSEQAGLLGLEPIRFTVDAALFRELGERLVGEPHIALAELVKNSYDADARIVVIRFSPNRIEIIDNGHGMNYPEFEKFWMRVGSPHKQEQRVSQDFKRPMTGSKGVGRLAVQFLARKLELHTVSKKDLSSELEAHVSWDEAVRAKELTEATAWYKTSSELATEFPDGSRHGTKIILSELNQSWTADTIVALAKEIWWLQPPFRSNPSLSADDQKDFMVELESPDEEAVREFDKQMHATLGIWYARLSGKLFRSPNDGEKGTSEVRLVLEFSDGTLKSQSYPVPHGSLHEVTFEIRLFKLAFRQPHGIKVGEARDYFREYGGVHVYDAGFHLPYYGRKEQDWLGIEQDHSHRLSKSQLLPDKLQVTEGMNFLPTNSRIFGVLHIDTTREHEEAKKRGLEDKGEHLIVQVSRDRLVGNKAYTDLQHLVRWALDFYAMEEAKRQFGETDSKLPVEPVRRKFERVDQVLARHEKVIPESVYRTLRIQVKEAIEASESEAEAITRQVGLLGSLATAGMSALAYEHEVQKQYLMLEDVAKQLHAIPIGDEAVRKHLNELAGRLEEWVERARATRALFSPLLDEENRDLKARFRARQLVRDVRDQMGVLMRNVDDDIFGIDDSLRLPMGTFTEWSAVFQNVFINAMNAMLDSSTRQIAVSSRAEDRERVLVIQDTGSGVDLATSEELFKPFERRLQLSSERRALGAGGTGLGLTIVRMIANNIGCKVSFVKPDEGFNTAFQISWSEQK